ncbi:MAG: hypothetical protein RSB98_04720 [Raoultibacter sp.]
MASEKRFEQKVRAWLESVGIAAAGTPENEMPDEPRGWYFKVWGGGYQKSGIPDLIINVNGFFVAVELKGETGRASDLQKKNVAMINLSGGLGMILYPQGFERFKYIVKGAIDCKCHILALNALVAAHSNISCDISTEY